MTVESASMWTQFSVGSAPADSSEQDMTNTASRTPTIIVNNVALVESITSYRLNRNRHGLRQSSCLL